MGVILDSWCFCKGVGKSEKMKASIFSGKAPAMARISVSGPNGVTSGTGFLIHRNLLLTTHLNLPSISATETAEVRLHNGVAAALFPHRSHHSLYTLEFDSISLSCIVGCTIWGNFESIRYKMAPIHIFKKKKQSMAFRPTKRESQELYTVVMFIW